MVVADPTSPQAPAGHALLICLPRSEEGLKAQMMELGFDVSTVDNPYAALVELLDRPLVYRSIVISLAATYREELSLIKTIRNKLPQIDVLVAHLDGRAAAMAEALRMGATGILDDKDVHRLPDTAATTPPNTPAPIVAPVSVPTSEAESADALPEEDSNELEPLLTADELRALLQEQPTLPGHG